ncbi:MAG: UDP-N-acetylglucosamine 2-epimerase (non-hydrolyzing) [Candidatus Anstonellales archaeon]
MQITTIIGTRPEIVKMAPLIPLLDKYFNHTLIFTSQHYSKDMVDVFFDELRIRRPDTFLKLKTSNIRKLELSTYQTLRKDTSQYIAVYGDTNSTLASARAAKRLGKKLIHFEAGLRSYDERMPEERNRVETDHRSDILFAPTELCRKQLAKEGIRKNVFVVGNLVVDACLKYSKRVKPHKGKYILVTAHRQENVDYPRRLMKILDALSQFPKVIYPIHPRTMKNIKKFQFKIPKNVKLIKPVGYLEFLSLLKGAQLVLTDSGGVQEEAITLHIPCLTLRESTERWETVINGGNFVVGLDPLLINFYAKQIIEGDLGARMRRAKNPYGDGKTAKRIIKILKSKIE